jgi:hypothetical protein
MDKARMMETGITVLYLTEDNGAFKVSNWPGSLTFRASVVRSHKRHNFGGRREDVYFNGPDGHVWWGWGCFENHQCFTARRTKQRWQVGGAA